MLRFAQLSFNIASTTKKLEKTALLAEYFRSVLMEEAAVAAVFFSGRPFPAWEETTLQVGGSMLWRIVAELSGKTEHVLTVAYRKHGDPGDVAEAVLPTKNEWSDGRRRLSKVDHQGASHSLTEIQRIFREIAAARRPAFKAAVVRQILES